MPDGQGQNKKKVASVKIVYKSFRDGKESRGPGTTVIYQNDVAFLSDAGDKIRDYIDYGKIPPHQQVLTWQRKVR